MCIYENTHPTTLVYKFKKSSTQNRMEVRIKIEQQSALKSNNISRRILICRWVLLINILNPIKSIQLLFLGATTTGFFKRKRWILTRLNTALIETWNAFKNCKPLIVIWSSWRRSSPRLLISQQRNSPTESLRDPNAPQAKVPGRISQWTVHTPNWKSREAVQWPVNNGYQTYLLWVINRAMVQVLKMPVNFVWTNKNIFLILKAKVEITTGLSKFSSSSNNKRPFHRNW